MNENETIEDMTREHRFREDYLRARNRIELQMQSIVRRLTGCAKGESKGLLKKAMSGEDAPGVQPGVLLGLLMPFAEAKSILDESRKKHEKRLCKMAGTLPKATEFLECVRGMGALSIAQILAEAGDPAKYDNPGKLWKRMGLAVFKGKSQRRTRDKEDAVEQGYNPRRRSVMWVIGDNLIRAKSPYAEIYRERKAYELERNAEMTKMHAHKRAHRYMEKRLLRDLWRVWRNGDSAGRDGFDTHEANARR